MPVVNRKIWMLVFNAMVGIALYLYMPVETEVAKGLAILVFIALMWVTETLHVSVTSLLVPLLAVLAHVFTVKEALLNYANPIIFLFLGGFALASALRKQGLDRAIAGYVIRLAGGSLLRASLLLFGLAAFISMWISNTATTAMMLPLALGILSRFEYKEHQRLYLFVLLGIAYSANIGGIGTLVGSPPNAIAAAALGLDFVSWMRFGVPVVMVLLPCMILLLLLILRPDLNQQFEREQEHIPMTPIRMQVLGVFLLTVALWLFSKPLSEMLGVEKGFDALVAVVAIVLLCVMRIVEWKDIERSTEWGVLLLFGGGITLSALLKATGASLFLANQVSAMLGDASFYLFAAAVIAFVVFMTELASNTASTALLVPIFISIAEAMGFPSMVVAVSIAIAASCAFMLPVATPPNAIVYGSGYVPQQSMIRVGFLINLLCIMLISLMVSLFF